VAKLLNFFSLFSAAWVTIFVIAGVLSSIYLGGHHIFSDDACLSFVNGLTDTRRSDSSIRSDRGTVPSVPARVIEGADSYFIDDRILIPLRIIREPADH
jgi:hypothetical protein